MVFQRTQLQCEIKQATENLSEEKLLEYKEIFSFFDRLLQLNVPYKLKLLKLFFLFISCLQGWRRIYIITGAWPSKFINV